MAEFDGNPVGERLRAAREARGLTLEDVVSRTRIPTRHLEAIERGEWDSLPASTYTVGFARSYANVVGLNGSEIAAELRTVLNQRQGIEAQPSYYEPTDPARVPPKLLVISTVIIIALLVGGYLMWRNMAFAGAEDGAMTEPEPVASPAAAVPNPAAVPAPAQETGPVALTANAEVWLRIYEADGQRLFEGVLQPGQRYEVPATAKAPLILTGRPDALAVTVGSTAIPPLGPAQRTIADVSLAPRDLLARVGTGAPPAAVPTPAATPTP
jgi:cytoskeletal protein RodZ